MNLSLRSKGAALAPEEVCPWKPTLGVRGLSMVTNAGCPILVTSLFLWQGWDTATLNHPCFETARFKVAAQELTAVKGRGWSVAVLTTTESAPPDSQMKPRALPPEGMFSCNLHSPGRQKRGAPSLTCFRGKNCGNGWKQISSILPQGSTKTRRAQPNQRPRLLRCQTRHFEHAQD